VRHAPRYRRVPRLGQLACTAVVFLLAQTIGSHAASASDYVVTKTIDTNVTCAVGDCSLREAIVSANANPGADRIILGSGLTYSLSRTPFDPDGVIASGAGDLDITGPLTIEGNGSTVNGAAIDRVFDIQGSFAVTINSLTITGGVARGFLSLGGGINIRGAAVVLNNTIVTGNNTAAELVERDPGGGVAVVGSFNGATGVATLASLTLNNSTISTNTASKGGGILCVLCALTATNAAITGNTAAAGDGGGIVLTGNSSTASLTASDLAGNSVVGTTPRGGGLSAPVGTSTVAVTRSRILSNTGTTGTGMFNTAATITATNNWWGCNLGPGGAGCGPNTNTVAGPVTVTPFLVLKTSASPAVIVPGGTSTFTADLTFNSVNADTSAGGAIPNGTSVGFSATLGTLAPSTRPLATGKATSTFTAGGGSGSASLNATVDGQTVTSTVLVGTAPGIGTHPQSQTIPSGQTATMSVVASGSPTLTYQWYVGASPSTASPIGGATGSTYTTPALSSTTSYWVRVSNAYGPPANSATATITMGTPPGIATQPQSQTIASGQTATMSVAGTGTGPLGYQWYVGASPGTAAPIGGATGTSYTTPALSSTTSYWVRVSSAYGAAANSATATITIGSAPVIGTQPQSQTIASGQTATISVAATGTGPLAYQWYVGPSGNTAGPVVGATGSSYTTPALSSTTSYWVRVSNAYGNASSNTATMTIPACTFALAAPSASVPATMTTGSVGLTSSAPSCAWTADSNSGFVAVTSPGAGSGAATIAWSVVANPITSARTGTITIAGLTFTITQERAAIGRRVANDFNHDGLSDLGVFRPAAGRFLVIGQPDTVWGAAGDMPVTGDFDGDGNPDIAVFRAANGTWYVNGGATVVWGAAGDIPVPGDYDGDGTTDMAVFRPSTGMFYIRNGASVAWGLTGDLPVVGDYDGDGIDDIAVYRPATGTWYIRNVTTAVFGFAADIPVPADYDGDGDSDIAVFRPSTGTWIIKDQYTQVWGAAGDVPVPVDRDSDGRAELGVFRRATGTWYFKNHATDASETVLLGQAGDIPLNRALPPVQTVSGDYDGDRKADLTVFRPSTGDWVSLRSLSGMTDYTVRSFGVSGDVPVGRDYDGDGKSDLAVYRPSAGRWFVLPSSTSASVFQDWGLSTDTPVPADYDGDGKADFAVYRPSLGRWVILLSSSNNTSYVQSDWGLSGDVPVPADYDGDGRADLAVFRPSLGRWLILNRITGVVTTRAWGLSGDLPAAADFDGDGKADLAVFRPSIGRWFISSSIDGSYQIADWGLTGDVLVPADYDGDGKADIAVFRPSSGNWYVRGLFNRSWGLSGDIPALKNP
jgi:CSLREA domain-containing protein